jgi:hypothetical protein
VLYNQRERAKERAKAEAGGENFWTPAFSEKVRTRLVYALGEVAGDRRGDVLERARQLILNVEGVPYLDRYGPNVTPAEDFFGHFMGCRDDVMPTALEALYSAMQAFGVGNPNYFIPTIDVDLFGRKVSGILEEERVAFDFTRGKMQSFKSKELHQEVIEPAMKLLHDPKFSEAEKAYQHALEEISNGKPGDAITDAGTALQETLTALDCDGNNLGPLIKSAKAKGLLAAHDARLTKAIEDVMVWAAAQRNEIGDSHWADKASKDDAWFIVHVVGALIVRLVASSGA